MEEDDEQFERNNSKRQIIFDSTSEQYKSIGLFFLIYFLIFEV